MNKHVLASCLSLSVLTTPLLFADPVNSSHSVITTYDNLPVEKIDILMERLPPGTSFDTKIILNQLQTIVGAPFSQTLFDEDLKNLSEEYDLIEPVVTVHEGRLFITLKIFLRPKIRSITWEGNSHIKTKALQSELDIKAGTSFDRQSFAIAFNKVKDYYVKKGYFESTLHYTTYLDPKTNEVDITVHITEGRSGKIENIIFHGFSKDEEKEILNQIITKKYQKILSLITGTGIYREDALQSDEMRIVHYLQNKGYADAKVHITLEEGDKTGRILVVISADKGPIYHFGKICFKGHETFSEQELEGQFLARPGSIYSPEKLRMTVQRLKDLCGRRGYIETQVQYEMIPVPGKHVYDVQFTISEGKAYKIGMIHVIGNVRTETHVILRESLLVPGEVFDLAKLQATQRKLESIGYFKTVNVYAVRTQDDVLLGENYRDVYIEVDETTTGNVSLFFGFSSGESGFGGLDLVETNFNMAGCTKVFKEGITALRGGGQFLRAKVNAGKELTTYTLSWMDPYFRDSPWRIGIDSSYSHNRLLSKDFDTDAISSSIYASYPINSLWTFGLKYRIKRANNHADSNATTEEKQQASLSGLLSAISSSLTFDSTDSALRPTRGFRSYIEGEFAGVGGDIGFLRLSYLNSYYTPLWPRATMKYRADFRFLNPILQTKSPTEVFMSERFFLGGENSVRGFKTFKLGPLFPTTDAPMGGVSSTLLSIECRQYVTRMLDIFAFADAGALSLSCFEIPTLRLTYGAGAKVDILNRLPIEFGWGFPVNPEDKKKQVKHFFFSMGGQF